MPCGGRPVNPAIAGVGFHVTAARAPGVAGPGWQGRAGVPGTTPNVALAAASAALKDAGLTPAELELIVVGTASPDAAFPATACLLQTELGAPPAGSLDVLAAEAGFLYALSVADAYLRTGRHAVALVVGADAPHPQVPIGPGQERITQSAAGALVLARERRGPRLLGCRLGAGDGREPAVFLGMLSSVLLPGEPVRHALALPGARALAAHVLQTGGTGAARLLAPDAPVGAPNAYLPVGLAQVMQQQAFAPGDTAVLLAAGCGGIWGAAAIRWEDA